MIKKPIFFGIPKWEATYVSVDKASYDMSECEIPPTTLEFAISFSSKVWMVCCAHVLYSLGKPYCHDHPDYVLGIIIPPLQVMGLAN